MNWLGHDFASMLSTLAERYGDNIAVYPEKGSVENDIEAISFTTLHLESLKFARRLKAAGVKPKDGVAILAENSLFWLYAWFGTSILGAVLIPLNTRLTWREIDYQLQKSKN